MVYLDCITETVQNYSSDSNSNFSVWGWNYNLDLKIQAQKSSLTSLKFNIWIGVTQILVLGKVYDISGAREILSSKITNATVIQGIKNIKKNQESECIFHKKFKTSREEK